MDAMIGLVCADCGEQAVDIATVEVHANPRDGFAVYLFRCPRCGEHMTGGCPAALDRLRRSGARCYELRPADMPPLAWDDLLDLHLLLATDRPVAELLGERRDADA